MSSFGLIEGVIVRNNVVSRATNINFLSGDRPVPVNDTRKVYVVKNDNEDFASILDKKLHDAEKNNAMLEEAKKVSPTYNKSGAYNSTDYSSFISYA